MEAKIEWKITWHCCICCNPAKGRVDFGEGWVIKIQLHKDEIKACQLTRTKFPKKIVKKITFKMKLHCKLSVNLICDKNSDPQKGLK
jgi:hypothetical protein